MCGLAGFIGGKDKFVDIDKFKTLMLYNLERGKDSTGMFFSEGLDPNSDNPYFIKSIRQANYFLEDTDISEYKHSQIAIGHCRSASWINGTKTTGLEVCHPFEYGNIILAHNGFIKNHDDLREKYELAKKLNLIVDSQVFAYLLNKQENFNVFEEYDGAAAMIIYNKKEPNTLYVYRDAERPLFCWKKTEDEIYISSLKESLKFIGGEKNGEKDIFQFEENRIYKFINGICQPLLVVKRDPKTRVITKKAVNTYCDYDELAYPYQSGIPFARNNAIAQAKENWKKKPTSEVNFDEGRKLYIKDFVPYTGIISENGATLKSGGVILKYKFLVNGQSVTKKEYIGELERKEKQLHLFTNEVHKGEDGRYWRNGVLFTGIDESTKSLSYLQPFINGVKASKLEYETFIDKKPAAPKPLPPVDETMSENYTPADKAKDDKETEDVKEIIEDLTYILKDLEVLEDHYKDDHHPVIEILKLESSCIAGAFNMFNEQKIANQLFPDGTKIGAFLKEIRDQVDQRYLEDSKEFNND